MPPHHSPRHLPILPLLVALLVTALPAAAADVVEPWSEGLSNLEVFTTFGGDGPASTGAVGMGLPAGFSLGVTLAAAEGEALEAGMMLMWTRSLGRLGELDLWGEYLPVGQEVELLGAQRALGVEWSGSAGGTVPYIRLSMADDGEERHVHPLVGWMFPTPGNVELHVELSSEEPAGGSWPLHLAVGPNWSPGRGLEVLPEVSVIWQPDGGRDETRVFFTVGICFDPTAFAPGPAVD